MATPAPSELAVLANAMSHRLATPARIVSGNVRLLHERMDGCDAEAAAALAALARGARRIDAIVDGLTRYARVADRPLGLEPVDAADEARIALTCTPQPEAWLLTIEDDGVGVPAADRARVFEPFVSIGGAGAGLGLTLARHIVERHGGAICLDAAAGGGTSVQVTLPRGPPADASGSGEVLA